jgi:hypothetical protein
MAWPVRMLIYFCSSFWILGTGSVQHYNSSWTLFRLLLPNTDCYLHIVMCPVIMFRIPLVLYNNWLWIIWKLKQLWTTSEANQIWKFKILQISLKLTSKL